MIATGRSLFAVEQSVAGRKDAADSVRAVSAAIVVVSHVVQIVWLPMLGLGTVTHRINSFVSDSAVIVFFVLSGFLITSSIAANVTRNSCFRVSDYLLHRGLRIVPPLLFATALSCTIFISMVGFQLPGTVRQLAATGDLYSARDLVSVTAADIWNVITLNNGLLSINGPLWSLYVEVKMYGIAAAVAFLMLGSGYWVFRVICTGGLVWVALKYGLGIGEPQWVYCFWWLFGVAFYAVGTRGRLPALLGRLGIGFSAVMVLVYSAAAVGLELARVAVVGVLTFAMFYRWRWSEPFTRAIAGYSYTLYLVHFPIILLAYAVLVAVSGEQPPSPAARLITSVIAFLVSFWCSQIAAKSLEDARGIQINLQALVAKAKRSV